MRADAALILEKYPHLSSPIYQIRPVDFDDNLLRRRVMDPCPVIGLLGFATLGEKYRKFRAAETQRVKAEASSSTGSSSKALQDATGACFIKY